MMKKISEKFVGIRNPEILEFVPNESEEQQLLFEFCGMKEGQYPILSELYHVPNGGTRKKVEAARLKREGVKKGVPDINLDYASCGYHGLRIEMKRLKGGVISPEQKDKIKTLINNRYAAVVCRGWEEAWFVIKKYIDGDTEIIDECVKNTFEECSKGKQISGKERNEKR